MLISNITTAGNPKDNNLYKKQILGSYVETCDFEKTYP